MRRRTSGRRRCWVVLWPATATRRAFFIGGGGGVGGVRRIREHWNSSRAGQTLFSGFYRGQPLYLWSPLSRQHRIVNSQYACCAQFHSRNELIVNCLISGGTYKCNVECWGDAENAGVENTCNLDNAGLKNAGIKNGKRWRAVAEISRNENWLIKISLLIAN